MRKYIIVLLFASVALLSCEKYNTTKDVNNNFKDNFEAFWKMVDEQYCYLDYKNIDWKGVYNEMMPRVEAAKTEQELFNILGESLDYLKDGHVWMIAPFKSYSCETYLNDENGEKYPSNFDSSIIRGYLKEVFKTSESGIVFGEIERDGHSYAYIYYPAFEDEFTEEDYKYITPILDRTEGLIFDIRNNPGGSGEIGISMAGQFFRQKTLIGYTAIKSGKGHNDFSDAKALHTTPDEKHNYLGKKTMLLTNRKVYSTANLFTSALKLAENVTQIGGITGGGGGMPMTHYLPNGWIVVFPANVLLDTNKEHIENGIVPDIEVTMTEEEISAGYDAIIERAISEFRK